MYREDNQTTIQPLYFMRYAQFYALAIFFMYSLCPRKVSSSWSVSLYMIFCFVSSEDGKAT